MNAYDKALDVLNGLDDAQLEIVPSLKLEVESYRQIYQTKLNKDEDK
jgi:hypothetical protein